MVPQITAFGVSLLQKIHAKPSVIFCSWMDNWIVVGLGFVSSPENSKVLTTRLQEAFRQNPSPFLAGGEQFATSRPSHSTAAPLNILWLLSYCHSPGRNLIFPTLGLAPYFKASFKALQNFFDAILISVVSSFRVTQLSFLSYRLINF